MQVGKLTISQKNEITGQQYAPDSYFNPIEIIHNTKNVWVISTEEMESCNNPQFMWVKDLPLIEYKPIS
jgi:hypothetical protein